MAPSLRSLGVADQHCMLLMLLQASQGILGRVKGVRVEWTIPLQVERPKGEEGRVQITGYLDTSAPKRRCWPQSKVTALDNLSRAAEIAKTSETARSAKGKTKSRIPGAGVFWES